MPAELIPADSGTLQRILPDEMQLIRELATDERVSVEKLAALMQLHERAEARDAEKQFNAAFRAASARNMPSRPSSAQARRSGVQLTFWRRSTRRESGATTSRHTRCTCGLRRARSRRSMSGSSPTWRLP